MRLTKGMKQNIVEAMVHQRFDAKQEQAIEGIKAKVMQYLGEYGLKGSDIPLGLSDYIITTKEVKIYRPHTADVNFTIDENYAVKSGRQNYMRIWLDEALVRDQLVGLDMVRKNKQQYRDDLEALMSAVQSDKALLELLPEIKPYLPVATEALSGALVPIALIDRIKNQMQEEQKP